MLCISCSYIDSSGYASEPIVKLLFIDYIIKKYILHKPSIYIKILWKLNIYSIFYGH